MAASVSLVPNAAVAQHAGEDRMNTASKAPLRPPAFPSSPPGDARLRPIEGGQMVAVVGSQVILASELMWPVNQRLASEYHGQLSPEIINQVREEATQNMQVRLPGLLDFKLVVNDVHANVPPEGIQNIEKTLSEPFEEQELPNLLEQFSVGSRSELDARLRQYGSSLEQLRQNYIEVQLVQTWIAQQITGIPPITRDELFREYQEHLEDYAYPAKARWQELMVRFDRFGGDRRAARRTLAEMGNAVLQGAPFEEVARSQSHGFTAADGGLHDWTAQGSLVTESIDAALFSMPVGGRPSEIIESPDGFHIVRVLERKPAGRTPFEEAQAEIREALVARKRSEKQREYLDRLRKDVRIWTIYTGHTTAEDFSKLVAANPAPQ